MRYQDHDDIAHLLDAMRAEHERESGENATERSAAGASGSIAGWPPEGASYYRFVVGELGCRPSHEPTAIWEQTYEQVNRTTASLADTLGYDPSTTVCDRLVMAAAARKVVAHPPDFVAEQKPTEKLEEWPAEFCPDVVWAGSGIWDTSRLDEHKQLTAKMLNPLHKKNVG